VGEAMAFISTAGFHGKTPVVKREVVSYRGLTRSVAPRRSLVVRMVQNVEEQEFEKEVLQSEVPVLVDFYADWCGPCKLVAPLMDWASNTYKGKLKVIKVDTDKARGFGKLRRPPYNQRFDIF